MICTTCKGKGRPTMCPMCGRLGKTRKHKRQPVEVTLIKERIRIAKHEWFRLQDSGASEEKIEKAKQVIHLLEEERVRIVKVESDGITKKSSKLIADIKELWSQATMGQWVEDRAEYIRIVKEVKRKENLLQTKD